MKMKRVLSITGLLAVAALLAAPALVSLDAAAATARPQSVDTAPLFDFGTTQPPRHGTTTLIRNADGIAVTVDTRHLRRNSAHTFWIVIFNVPTQCADGIGGCAAADLANPDVQPSLAFGGALITDDSGRMRVSSGLDVGVAPGPPGPDIPQRFGFGPGLLFPFTAEIHIVIQDHLGLDLDQIHAMLQRPGTGPDGVVDVQGSIHAPS